MNCRRCHHIDEAHTKQHASDTLVGLGRCNIPYCTCRQYEDIAKIDEELL